MPAHLGANMALYALLLIIPVTALLARRVPVVRTLLNALSWVAIFGALLIVVGQRERFDLYISRLAGWLKLDEQAVVGKEVRIRMAGDGHFWARVRPHGVERRMLIDSGATLTALSEQTASDAGLDVHQSVFPMIIRTANGSINADVATVGEMHVGDIVARDVPVVVSPAFGDNDVLGMNFLSRLKSWRVEGRTLILEPHHPQPDIKA